MLAALQLQTRLIRGLCTAPAAQYVLRDVQDGVCTLTLNNPRKRNALSTGMMGALSAELAAAAQDESVRVVVLAARGPVFSSGHDLTEMRELQESRDSAAIAALFEQCSDLMSGIESQPQPVIAKVAGVATAAGCQLVASCDLALASLDSTFSTPGVHIGLFCHTPAVALCRSVGRKAAMHMLLTGEQVTAEDGVRHGLINRAVPLEQLDDAVDQLAASLALKPSAVVAGGKRAFYAQLNRDVHAAYAQSGQVMARGLEEQDAVEGIDAFLSKRKPTWT